MHTQCNNFCWKPLLVRSKYLFVRSKYLLVRSKYIFVRSKYLFVRSKYLFVRSKYLFVCSKYLLRSLKIPFGSFCTNYHVFVHIFAIMHETHPNLRFFYQNCLILDKLQCFCTCFCNNARETSKPEVLLQKLSHSAQITMFLHIFCKNAPNMDITALFGLQ